MLRKLLYVLLTLCLIVTFNLRKVSAESKYNIKEMTPKVMTSLENRRNRFDKIRELKVKAAIGENNRGYIELLISDDQASEIVEAENIDRKIIYETIAKQNDIENAIATIEEVFAQVQRDKAEAGDKIQNKDGAWVIKE